MIHTLTVAKLVPYINVALLSPPSCFNASQGSIDRGRVSSSPLLPRRVIESIFSPKVLAADMVTAVGLSGQERDRS